LSAAEQVREYQLNAVFMVKLARYVDWPNSSQTISRTFCIIKDENVFRFLESQADKVNIKVIKTSAQKISQEELTTCDVIYVGKTVTDDQVAQISDVVANLPSLLISNKTNFVRQNGHVEIYLSNSRPLFKVNLRAAKRLGITFSSKLLELAKVIVK
jgi:hypothetical protein